MADQTDDDGAWNLGLRGRLLAATLLVVVLAFGLVWWVATVTAREGLVSLSDANLELGADNLARAIRDSLLDARADALTAARLDLAAEAIDSGDPKNLEWYADELVETKGRYAALVVANAEGEIVAANTVARDGRELEESLVGREIAAPWVTEALRTERDEAIWVEPSQPEFLAGALGEGELVVGFSLPVLDILDDRIGTLTLFVSLDFLGDLLSGYVTEADVGVGFDSLALVTDGDGAVVVRPTQLRDDDSWTLPDDDEGVVSAGPDDERFRTVPEALGGDSAFSHWRVVQLRRVASYEAAVDAIGGSLLLTFGGALALTVLVLVVVATRFLGPIRRLTEALGGASRASELGSLSVETEDEVGTLTRTFNEMFSTIRDYERGLEDKVAERTRELAEAKKEVSDILDHMSQGIFTVSPEGNVNKEFSAHCLEVFGDRPIAGEPMLDLLQITPEANQQQHSRMRFWLNNIFGTDELQWVMSDADRVPEIAYRPGTDVDAERNLELEYAPIYEDGKIVKVMVIAKDVTQVARLTEEVIEKEKTIQDNLSRVSEIAQMDPELFEVFIGESKGILQTCEETVTTLAPGATDEAAEGIAALFRGMHTLKGNARIFKVTSVQDQAHAAEDFLQEIRDGERTLDTESIEALRGEVERLRELLLDFERLGRRVLGIESAAKLEDLSGRTRRVAEQMRAQAAPEQLLDESATRFDEIESGVARWRDAPTDADAVHALLRTTHSLKAHARSFSVGELQSAAGALEEALIAVRDRETPAAAADVEEVGSLVVALAEVLDECRRYGGVDAKVRRGPATKVTRARILELRRAYKELLRTVEASGDTLPAGMRPRYEELGSAVQGLTMVPLSELFERYRKMVFDLAIELGKRVDDLEVIGGEIEVDEKLVDKMRDVILHALRNALDHGLESPEDRPKDKPARGRLTVRCDWEDEDLVVAIRDDGRGIDVDAVKRRAWEGGFLDEGRLDDVSHDEALELLFRPGFSMAERVTDVSGRGVGMDVIRTTMRELKGDSSIASVPGKSTTLTLRIPADYYQQL